MPTAACFVRRTLTSIAPFTIVLLALAIAMSWWIREVEMTPAGSAVASTEAGDADGE